MLTVHLRINDAATGRPTAVRVRVTGPDGAHFAPFGRVVESAGGRNEDVGGHLWVGRERWSYIDGACEIQLPAGVPLRVQAAKGPEYSPLDATVTLGPGQMALRFAVERWSDFATEGWHAGDTRCHFLPPHAALLEAAAEDVSVVNLLACEVRVPSQDGTAYQAAPNMTAFSGQTAALEAGGRLVAVNTLNVHPVLGRVGLLHSHRPVFPLGFGGEDATDDWSVCDWCDQCHRKRGLVVWVEPFRGDTGGEALAALVLGKVDALEIDGQPRPQPLLPWVYKLWNAGFPVSLAGGSGKESNRIAVGAVRTYARLAAGEPLAYTAWIDAVRAGRTFATTGPLLTFTVEGVGPGEAATVPDTGRPLTVAVVAKCLTPFDKLEVVADGRVVGEVSATRADDGVYAASLTFGHAPAESGWLAARCHGANGATFAHTSPVRVHVAGRPQPRRADAVAPLSAYISRAREWVVDHGRFADEKARRHLLAHLDAALAGLGGGA